MNDHRNIEKQLEELGDALGGRRQLATPVLQAIETIDLRAERASHRRRVWTRRSLGGLAAGLVLACTLVFLLGRPTTLFAQVLDALATAHTAHGVLTFSEDERVAQRVEFWFDQERGTAVLTGDPTKPRKAEIDDGHFLWSYVPGNEFVVQLPSQGPREKFARMTNFLAAPFQWVARPPEDLAIEGLSCRALEASVPESSKSDVSKLTIWVDPENRLRRVVALSPAGKAQAELRYNVRVDPRHLDTTFGQDLRIMHGAEALAERFSLEGALLLKEVAGMIFAVHDVRRGEGGIAYIVSSVRPTDEARKEPRPDGIGGYVLVSHEGFDGFEDRYQFELARLEARDSSLSVRWWLRVPKSPPAAAEVTPSDARQVTFSVQPGTFDARYRSQVPKRVGEGLIEASLPLPPSQPLSVDAIARELHRDTTLFEDVANVRLNLRYEEREPEKKGALWNYLSREKPPRDIPTEEHVREVQGLVDFFRERRFEKR